MKIAFILHKFPRIPQTFIINQITGLIEEGHEVDIYSERIPNQDTPHSKISEYSLDEGIIYFDPPERYFEGLRDIVKPFSRHLLRGRIDGLSYLKYGKTFPKKIMSLDKWNSKKRDYDVIHFHFGGVARLYYHLIDETDAKSFASFYGSDVSSYTKKHGSDVYHKVFKKNDHIIALSDNMAQDLQKLGCNKRKIRTVKLGIDLEKFEFRPREKSREESYKILTVGRFVEKKGIKYGLETVAKLKEKYHLEYNIVGDGELRGEIEEKIEELGLQEEVDLHGYVEYSRMREMMYENHILLAPSVKAEDGDKEGAPMVIIEGQATGMPVISTRHSGIPEIVKEGESAYLAEERNSKELSEKLEKMMEESDRWNDKALAGRGFIEKNHSIDRMVEKLEDLYRD